jgi:hypothetical protein
VRTSPHGENDAPLNGAGIPALVPV